jgi:hypothetical protein
MAWTQADLDALDAAIKSGTRQVRFADREVTYMSMDDLLKARSLAAAIISSPNQGVAAATQQPLNRQRRMYTSKGF